MATKFLDYTGLSYLWGKIKAWCNATFVHLTTDENITGTKTFVGSKKIAFKQSTANDKLGFTLYNNSSKEQGYLEYNPTNKIANVPLFTLGNYATTADELTYIGFRRYSNISGASGAYNLLAPLISDAKTPFSLTTTYTNFYLPLGVSDGTNIVKASNSGVIDISSLFPPTYSSSAINLLTGYTKPSTSSALTVTDTLNQALGKLEVKVDEALANNSSVPVGTVVWLTTSTVPIGFLLCNGQAVGRDTYPDLFSAIGTTYGEGDGSTTFNLPNLIDKFIEGTNTNVGTSVAAGLPEISGNINPATVFNNTGTSFKSVYVDNPTGAFSAMASAPRWSITQAGTTSIDMAYGIQFNASKSNSIYGNSNTVQPPALKLLPCIKAYSSVSNISELDAAELENEVQNNFVHKTGDELVQGVKEFKNAYADLSSVPDNLSSHSIVLRTTQFRKGTDFTTLSNEDYISFIFQDNEGSLLDHDGRLGSVEYTASTNGSYFLSLRCFKNDLTAWNSFINVSVGYDVDGVAFATAPATSVDRTHGTDIVTRNWIPKDTRIVHTSGDEVINGTKEFSTITSFSSSLYLKNTNLTKSSIPSSNAYKTIYWVDKNDESIGRILFYQNSSANGSGKAITIDLHTVASSPVGNTIMNMGISNAASGSNASYIAIGSNVKFMRPSTAGTTLGSNSTNYRWGQIYSSSTTISTSDERMKDEITVVPDKVLDCWEFIPWVQFKMKDSVAEKGDKARLHNGIIAQTVIKVFEDFNLDASRYGLFCYDEWDEDKDQYDDKDNLVYKGTEAGNLYSIRYEEALCMEAAYQRRKNKILENRISELERQVSDMLQILQSLKGAS